LTNFETSNFSNWVQNFFQNEKKSGEILAEKSENLKFIHFDPNTVITPIYPHSTIDEPFSHTLSSMLGVVAQRGYSNRTNTIEKHYYEENKKNNSEENKNENKNENTILNKKINNQNKNYVHEISNFNIRIEKKEYQHSLLECWWRGNYVSLIELVNITPELIPVDIRSYPDGYFDDIFSNLGHFSRFEKETKKNQKNSEHFDKKSIPKEQNLSMLYTGNSNNNDINDSLLQIIDGEESNDDDDGDDDVKGDNDTNNVSKMDLPHHNSYDIPSYPSISINSLINHDFSLNHLQTPAYFYHWDADLKIENFSNRFDFF